MSHPSELHTQMAQWRHHLHQHPETGFEEKQTSDYVAQALQEMGLDVHRGIGGTGLVANPPWGPGAAQSASVPTWTR